MDLFFFLAALAVVSSILFSGLRIVSRSASSLRRALIALPLAFVVVAIGTYRISKSRSFQFFGDSIPRVETAEPIVALTFDDGPTRPYTAPVLNLLRSKGVTATFFLTGAEVTANPVEARAIVAAGHEIGNHSWSHPRMVFMSSKGVKSEIERTDAAIRAAGWSGGIHFRSPHGKRLVTLPLYLQRTNRKNIFFDVEPESDPSIDGDASKIAAHVIDRARPGSIILLHVMYDSREATREALPLIIDGLRKKGLRFVTVSELLARQAG
jgi:peptidoglycan/xylan/chitin deacetylase (PgdA/CDA1 family)